MNFLTMMYQRMRFRWMNKRGIAENERKENHRMLQLQLVKSLWIFLKKGNMSVSENATAKTMTNGMKT